MRTFRFPKVLRPVAVAALCGGVALGCQDLTVGDPNNPGYEDVFTDPVNVETAIGSSWRVFWGVAQGSRTNGDYPVVGLSALGDEITPVSTSGMGTTVSPEPRTQEYDNTDPGAWFNRKPYYDLYEVVATNADALRAINNGFKVVTADGVDHTARARWWSTMMQGLAYVYLGSLYDQAFIYDESQTVEEFDFEFSPYSEVHAFGIQKLKDALVLLEAAPADPTPTSWVWGVSYTNDQWEQIIHSYIARSLAMVARNPAERAAVDWTEVITHIDQGLTFPFVMDLDATVSGATSNYKNWVVFTNSARAHPRLYGPADTSGAYQAWLALPVTQRDHFLIRTPDKRILDATAASARVPGLTVVQRVTSNMVTTYGSYRRSRYKGAINVASFGDDSVVATMNPTEMRFLKAEALIRLGRYTEALPLINQSRTKAGLPNVTIFGPPNVNACVPQREDGSCGDLFDALMYEKRMETYGLEAIIPYSDRRGWGLLVPGTLISLPVIGRELTFLNKPYYTFGGDIGGEGTAPERTGPQVTVPQRP